jgi:hypothetical protein
MSLVLFYSLLTQLNNENDNDIKSGRVEITEQFESLKGTQIFIENIMLANTFNFNKSLLCRNLTRSLAKKANF